MFERNFSLQSWAELIRLQYFLIISGRNQLISYQYLWNKSSDLLDFLLKDNHQRKVASETTLDVASCVSCPIRFQDSLIINISGENPVISQIFGRKQFSAEGRILDYPFWLVCQLCISSTQVAGFFDHQYLQQKSGTYLSKLQIDAVTLLERGQAYPGMPKEDIKTLRSQKTNGGIKLILCMHFHIY